MSTFFGLSFCYLFVAVVFQAFVSLLLFPLSALFARRLGISSFSRLLWVFFVFNAFLLFWGALGSYTFHLLTYRRLYVSVDYMGDWFPFMPFGHWVITREFAGRHGHLIGDATIAQLFLIWLAIAVPVWVLTFYSTRYTLRLPPSAFRRFAHAEPMA